MQKVSIEKCEDYIWEDVYGVVKKAVGHLGGMESFVKQDMKVLVKPNLVSRHPPQMAINTHPMVVKAVVELVKEAGGLPIIGESPGAWDVTKVAEGTGIADIIRQTNVKLENFEESVEVDNIEGSIFKKIEIAKTALDADVIISVPKLKTHVHMGMTLSVKNMFGCVIGGKKAQWHFKAGTNKEYFARMLVELYRLVKPKLAIVDGIIGMEGEGPGRKGSPRKLGFVIAGTDCVAVDSVISYIVGAKPEDVYTNKVAYEMGVGEINLDRIEIVGTDIGAVRISDFKFAPVMDNLEPGPQFLHRFLKDWLTPKPIIDIDKCKLCSVCINSCPSNIMRLEDTKISIDYGKCIRCFCCHELCPEGAVNIKEPILQQFRQSKLMELILRYFS